MECAMANRYYAYLVAVFIGGAYRSCDCLDSQNNF